MEKYDKQTLEEICKRCYSYAQVIREYGNEPSGGNYEIIKRKIKQYNIDISHFTHGLWNKGKTAKEDNRIHSGTKYTEEEIFSKNSPFTRHGLREYILRNNSIEYRCALCGNPGIWMGYTIGLDLDHKDGDPENNCIDNLRFLCPNCHATTTTYRGRNKKNNNSK